MSKLIRRTLACLLALLMTVGAASMISSAYEDPDLVGKAKLSGAKELSEGLYFLSLRYKSSQVITADKACNWGLYIGDKLPLPRDPENVTLTVAPDGKSATIEALKGSFKDGYVVLIVTPVDSPPYAGGSPDDASIIVKVTAAWWQWLIIICLFGFLWY